MPDVRSSYENLLAHHREASLLGSCAGLLSWDEQTYMPKGGGQHRAEQLTLLSGMIHDRTTDPRIEEWLGAIEGSDLVSSPLSEEAVNVREFRRSYDRNTRLPKALVEELTRVTTLSEQAWREARKNSDFAAFQPHLTEVVRLKREEAAALGGGEGKLYDALLDDYEPGARSDELTPLFAALRDDLVKLLDAIQGSSRKPDASIMARDYPVDRQEAFGRMAAEAIAFDFETGRLDVTTHPFCTGLGPNDTRITTRYDRNEFNQAFFGILHEAGHGLYDQGLRSECWGTPMGDATSLGIHESQSRMWENFVGRSPAFWKFLYPRAQETFPEALSDVSVDDFVFAANDVRPSFIRVEADEVTYNLHILLRFEIEQALIGGDLAAADLPGAWNEKFTAFFGLTPADDAQGCLQDVHWGAGLLGYFPTYSLGNLFAAQFFDKANEDLGDLYAQFEKGQFAPLKDWLTEKIYVHGSRYRARELAEVVTGKSLSHEALVQHLNAKFGALYGF